MTVKLIVLNLPPNLSPEEFRAQFMELRGFQDSKLLLNPNNELYGILEFNNYELADYARKIMSNFVFPGSTKHINIDFFKSQDSYDHYQGFHGQNLPHSISTPQNIPGNMNYPSTMGGYHYQNQGLEMEGQTGGYISKPGQNFPPENRPYIQPSNLPSSAANQLAHNPNVSTGLPMIPQNPNVRAYGQNPPYMVPYQQSTQSQYPNMMGTIQQGGSYGMQGGFQSGGGLQQKGGSVDSLSLFKVPSNATNSIYVDGVPIDANEREVAHMFRPFPGFQEVRLIKKETKGGRQFYFCFVDFENEVQATIALVTLQGYRFDKNDSKGLKISYAFHSPDGGKGNKQMQNQRGKFKSKKK